MVKKANTSRQPKQNREKKDIVNGHACIKCGKFHKWPKFLPKYWDIPIIHFCDCETLVEILNGNVRWRIS